jgi:hypothetical protein
MARNWNVRHCNFVRINWGNLRDSTSFETALITADSFGWSLQVFFFSICMICHGMLIRSYMSVMVVAKVSGHHVGKTTAISGAKACESLPIAVDGNAPFNVLVVMLICASLIMNRMKHLF